MKSLAVLVILSLTTAQLSTAQLTSGGNISSNIFYKEGTWTGNIACDFYGQLQCVLSIHERGRRIDLIESYENEEVFVSCIDTTTSIGLSISNITFDNLQEYTCLQDISQQYLNTWLNAFPYVEVEGEQEIGSFVHLTCNSFPGAQLYWILPGSSQDNADVIISDTSNDVNSSISAIFRLDETDVDAEYKCCMKMKSGQSEFPCTTHTFYLDVVVTEDTLISASADYTDTEHIMMTCVIKTEYVPSSLFISWQECDTNNVCYSAISSYYNYTIDNKTNTLTTTLSTYYTSSYPTYKCYYDSKLFYTFNVTIGTSAPKVSAIDKQFYYSGDGFAVKLGCYVKAIPPPTITWTKQNVFNFSHGFEIIDNADEFTIQTTQISDREWQSTLIIYPYDVNEHNAIYQCVAENNMGQQSLQFNTYDEPANLQMCSTYTQVADTQYKIRAYCKFKAFPNPPQYDVNVINVEDIDISTTVSYNNVLMELMVIKEFVVDKTLATLTVVQCSSLNPFQPSSKQFAEIFVNSDILTTSTPMTTTTTSGTTTTYTTTIPHSTTTASSYPTTTPYYSTVTPYYTTETPYYTTGTPTDATTSWTTTNPFCQNLNL